MITWAWWKTTLSIYWYWLSPRGTVTRPILLHEGCLWASTNRVLSIEKFRLCKGGDFRELQTVEKMLKWCFQRNWNSTEYSWFKNATIQNVLCYGRVFSELLHPPARRFFVNEGDSSRVRENGTVRIITLRGSTRFSLAINDTAKYYTVFGDVHGICRATSRFR